MVQQYIWKSVRLMEALLTFRDGCECCRARMFIRTSELQFYYFLARVKSPLRQATVLVAHQLAVGRFCSLDRSI